MTNKKGTLIILSGPSGVGKGTLVKLLLSRRQDTVLSVSMTTRAPRTEDVEGVTYFFRTREEFEALIAENAFLEYAEYNGNYYGTPIAPVEKWLDEGKNVILEIEVCGAEKVMALCRDYASVFLTIPSFAELERRLRERASETEDSIRRRLAIARDEMAQAHRYDYIVLNDELELAVKRLDTIIDAEAMRYCRMENTVTEVMNDVSTQ